MKCWCTTDIKKTFIYFFNMHVAVWLPGQVFFHFCCSAVLMEAPRIKDIISLSMFCLPEMEWDLRITLSHHISMLFLKRFCQNVIVTPTCEWRLHTSGHWWEEKSTKLTKLFLIPQHIKLLIYFFQLTLVLGGSHDKGSCSNMNTQKSRETDAILALICYKYTKNSKCLMF